jgi:hypothetical protein
MPVLLLRPEPAINNNGVKVDATIDYPANTLGLPRPMYVHAAKLLATHATGLPFTNTLDDPLETGAICGKHFFPTRSKCTVVISPILHKPNPLANTSPDALCIL